MNKRRRIFRYLGKNDNKDYGLKFRRKVYRILHKNSFIIKICKPFSYLTANYNIKRMASDILKSLFEVFISLKDFLKSFLEIILLLLVFVLSLFILLPLYLLETAVAWSMLKKHIIKFEKEENK